MLLSSSFPLFVLLFSLVCVPNVMQYPGGGAVAGRARAALCAETPAISGDLAHSSPTSHEHRRMQHRTYSALFYEPLITPSKTRLP